MHLGHLAVAKAALEEMSLDKIYVVPAKVNPFRKDAPPALPDGVRLEIIRRTCLDTPQLVPCDIEIRRGGVSYAVDTVKEIAAMEAEQRKWELAEKSRPLTADEVNRLYIAQNIQTIITDDATASRAVEFHPEMQYNGSLIPAKIRINWKGKLKRAAVDLWDTEANNPDNAPNLWENIEYKDGFRIIPETITATLAFAMDEYGWWKDKLYRSKVNGNVYNPDVYPGNWEDVNL